MPPPKAAFLFQAMVQMLPMKGSDEQARLEPAAPAMAMATAARRAMRRGIGCLFMMSSLSWLTRGRRAEVTGSRWRHQHLAAHPCDELVELAIDHGGQLHRLAHRVDACADALHLGRVLPAGLVDGHLEAEVRLQPGQPLARHD